MENKKPNNFKEAALSHIPPEFLVAMEKQSHISSEDMEHYNSEVKRLGPQIQAGVRNTKLPPADQKAIPQEPVKSQEEPFKIIAINNVAIKVPADPWQASLTMVMFLLATVWSKDKKVAKVLKAFNFSLQDCNGAILYPPQKKAKK